MGKQTLIAMNREFGTEAHDVIAAIGPSICQDCYEVSQDVAEHFVDEFATTDDPHASDILLYKGDGKYQLNLWECNRRVLVEGIPDILQILEKVQVIFFDIQDHTDPGKKA